MADESHGRIQKKPLNKQKLLLLEEMIKTWVYKPL